MLKIYDEKENTFELLVDLICKNGEIFETPKISDKKLYDTKYMNDIGEIRITDVKKIQTFEDIIDKTYETKIFGKAHVGLNIFVDFCLIIDDIFATLLMTDNDGEIIKSIMLKHTI